MNASDDRADCTTPGLRSVCMVMVTAMSLVVGSGIRCACADAFESQMEGLVIGDENMAPESLSANRFQPEQSAIIADPDGEHTAVSADDGGTVRGDWEYPRETANERYPGRTGMGWNVTVDALMLWQGNAQSLPLFLDTAGGTAFNAQDLQTQMGSGVRVGAIRTVGERYAIEGNYFQARPFNATGYAPQSGGPYTLTNTGNLAFADIESATVSSSGWIQSAELNWRKNECWSPITWLAGFRWVELNSQANVDYRFANTDPSAYGTGTIDTNAGNNLYGGQMGADVRLWNKGGRWRANAVGKAGVFYNAASFQRSTAGFVTNNGVPSSLGTVAATADQTSFFGELGMNSTYWITDWLAWRAGYTVMWAAGVAVAQQQLPLNYFGSSGTATIDTNGSVLLHGVTTGIEARW